MNPIKETLKLLAMAIVAGAAVTPDAQALITYDFNNASLQGWNNRVWDGSAWTDLAPNATTYSGTLLPESVNNGLFVPGNGAVWISGSNDFHLNTLWLRSPQFYLNGTGDLTFQVAKGTARATWTVPMNDSAVPFAAATDTGWMGVALRTVSNNQFVLIKPKNNGNGDGYGAFTFTQAELAPYVGVACTLELINADRGSWGWITMDNVSIPGDASPPGATADIVSFTFPSVGAATISGTSISVSVPFGTNVTSLAPTYTTSLLATGSPASGSVRDFTTPQSYTITSQNGTTQSYTVTLTVQPDNPAVINVNYAGGSNPGNAWLNGYISEDLTASGSASRVAPIAYSGSFWNDFTGGGNNSSNLKNSAGVATGIGLTSTMQGGPWNDWNGLGGNRMLVSGLIASYPAYSTLLAMTGLNPTHTYSLAIASLHNSGSQTSTFRVGTVEKALAYTSVSSWTEGKTHVLFTGLIPAANGTLNVEAKSTGELVLNGLQLLDTTPLSDIVSFTFPGYGAATINGTNVSINLPYGTDVSSLAPTYRLSYGATCAKASGSSQNFTSPVHYLITASDSSTKDYTVTVNVHPIPDPQFTLIAPASWDGRQTITVSPTITNASEITAAGGSVQGYQWSVSGVATARSISANIMTLTRAEGNGPLIVSLALNTGGAIITRTAVITVQQPTSDAWVQRQPEANEKPIDGQFFARDDTGYGTIFYRGTETGSPDSVYLKVYRTDTGADVQYGTTLSQTPVGGTYSFAAPILGGLYKYKVVYGKITGTTDTPLATVSNLICGDAYILQGQSNTLAELPNNGTPPAEDYYTSDWIRSYGTANTAHALSSNAGEWGVALRTRNWETPLHGRYQIGAWGVNMARILLETYDMPICVINGAVGGTRIDEHQRNDSNQESATTIYGRLLTRMKAAKLTHGVRAVLWHQGENDQGSTGPYSPELNYKFYQENFISMTSDWKENYPNLKNYYIFQILPGACGGGNGGDELREIQRNLPSLYSNMRIMTSLGAEPGDRCHYSLAGYQTFADQVTPLLEQDLYGRSKSEVHTAPNLQKAYFTSANRTEIALEFGQSIAWNPGAPGLFYLDGIANKVASGTVSGNIIKLQLTTASTASTITYVMGSQSWNRANVLYGTNGVAALTFQKVPLTVSTTVPYTSWIGGKGLSGANALGSADPDHDGIQNALECVLGGEPNPAAVGSNSVALLPTPSASGGDLVFRFKRKDASEGAVNLTFQWSTDLAFSVSNTVPVSAVSTTPTGVTIGVVEDAPDAATDDIVITVPISKAAGGRIFGRLQATVP
jgi:Carbohydrate esterase, sialic acid-specific acetylesterase